jgi:O-antigen/teichoic acid export membrane protein
MSAAESASRPDPPSHDLRRRVFKGGAAIAVRQTLGMGLSVLNVMLVTRIIGPTQYGVFAAAYGIVAFIANAGTLGIDVYLLRKSREPSREEYNQAFTLLLLASVAFVTALLACHHAIARLAGIPELPAPLCAMSLYVPLSLLSMPGVVSMDRALQFGRIAAIELSAQAAGYVVAVPLAFLGWGAWAPVDGMLTTQCVIVAMTYWYVRLPLRLHMDRTLARDMLGYGLSYSGAIWIWQLRSLVNPLIVGHFAGARGVGLVALAIRLVEVLSFAKQATWRLAMVALAKLDESASRLRRSITEGMRLQSIAVGLPMAVFALLAPYVLPPLFGSRWDPAFHVFPFIALSYLINANFNLHTSVLFLFKKNMRVLEFHTLHVVLFAASAALLVPRFGYMGYGWAEVAALPGYLILNRPIRALVGSPDYSPALLWTFVCTCVIASGYLPLPFRIAILALLPAPLLLSSERAALGLYGRLLFRPREAANVGA